MPTRSRRMTSRANDSFRSACSMAAPPYLMTTALLRNSRMYGSASMRISTRLAAFSMITGSARLPAAPRTSTSQDVAREVLIAPDFGEPLPHVLGVDRELLARHVRGVEGHVLQELLHHRVEASRADVLRAPVH